MVKNLPTIERSTRLRFGKNCLEDQAENTIVFNASNVSFETPQSGGVYISPVRFRPEYEDDAVVLLMYNKDTKEITESGEAAYDIIATTLDGATLRGNTVTVDTVVLSNAFTSLVTTTKAGIVNTAPEHTLSVGSNLFVNDEGSNVLTVIGSIGVSNDITVDGNLRVNGTTAVIYTENTKIKDAIVELGTNNTSTDTTLDLGFLMNRPESNVMLAFKESSNEFVFAYTNNTPNDVTLTPLTDEDIHMRVYGSVTTETNVNVLQNLNVTGNAYADKDLIITGNVHALSNVDITQSLNVTGNVYADKDLIITGNTYALSNVDITKNLNVTGNAYAEKDLLITGNVYASSNVDITNKLNVTGNIYASRDILVSGNVNVVSNVNILNKLNISSNVHAKKDMKITGNVAALSNVSITKDLNVTGNTQMYKDLNITGNIFASTNVSVSEQLNVTGNTQLYQDLHVTGNSYVTGNVEISKDLHITGNVYGSTNVNVTEQLNVTGNVQMRKDVHITGNNYVTGNVNITRDLNVTNETRLTKNVHMSKDLLITGNNYVTGNVIATRDISANKYYGDGGHLSNVTLQVVTDHSNTTSNTVHFTNPHTAFVTNLTSNVEVKLDQLNNVTVQTPLESQQLIYQDTEEWINEYPGQTFLKIYNATADTIYAGNAVYIIQQHNANLVEVGLADARDPDKMPCIGLVWETSIAPGGEGHATTFGKSQAFKTSQFLEGETLYVSNVYAGMLSNVKPYGVAGNVDKIQNVGICSRVHASSGRVTVTGIGRSNDIPNANIVTSNATVNYVYVNTTNNDMKKIDPMKLPTKLQTLRDVVNTGNVVSNAISVTGLHVTNGGNVISSGNVQAGANVSIAGLGNKYLPYVSASKYLKDSFIRQETDGRIVISADLEVTGNVTVEGNSFEVSSGQLVVSDRIIDISNGAVTHDIDSGILIEHPGHNIGLIHHGDTDTFSMGYTQNGYADSQILEDSNIFTLDVIGNVVVQNTVTIETGDLIVAQGNSYFEGNVSVVGDTIVSGNIHTESNLNVQGNVYIEGNTVMDGNLTAGSLTLTRGPLKIGNLFNAGPGDVPGVGSVVINGVVQSLAFRTAHDSGYNTGIANTSPDNTFSVGANAYINAYGTRTLSITGNTFTTNLYATSNIGINIPANKQPQYSLDVRGTANVGTFSTTTATVENDLTVNTKTLKADASEGKVGISTETPNANLHVTGNTYITSNLTVDTNTLHVDANEDRVGVGMITPKVNLDVYGAATTGKSLQLRSGNSAGGNGGVQMIFSHNNNSYDASGYGHSVRTRHDSTTMAGNAIDFYIWDQSTDTDSVLGTKHGMTITGDGYLGIGTTTPGSNLHVVGNVFITSNLVVSNLAVDTDTLVVESRTGRVGIQTDDPTEALDVVGTVKSTAVSSGTGTFTGTVTTAGLSVAADTDVTGSIGRAKVGYVGFSDVAGFAHYDLASTGSYAFAQNNLGATVINSSTGQPIYFRENNADKMVLSSGKLGIGESSPSANLHVSGGIIINSGASLTNKKTYSWNSTLASGTTIADGTITITFSNYSFYAKIIAQLTEDDNEVSTMSLEVGGGNAAGDAPTLNISEGSLSIFGGTNTNPWSPVVTTTETTVAIKPTTNMAADGTYSIFIEYIAPNSSGAVTKITEGSSDVVTFGY